MCLFKPKWKSKDFIKQINWVKNANPDIPKYQKILASLAKSDNSSVIRKAALVKLTDEALLADIAKNDDNADVRKAALEMVSDKSVIADIALNDKDYFVSTEALKRIKDKVVITNIAKNCNNHEVRQFAYRLLGLEHSQEAWADIAKHAGRHSDRTYAVTKLTDQKLLFDVVISGSIFPDVPLSAIGRITDQELISELAKYLSLKWSWQRNELFCEALLKLDDKSLFVDLSKDKFVLIAAILKYHDKIALQLIKKGIELNLQTQINDKEGMTALMMSCADGHIEIAKLLIDYGAKVNLTDNEGAAALMYASERGYIDIVKLLVDNGAEINLKDNKGETALQKAKLNNYKEVVNYLISVGASEPESTIESQKKYEESLERKLVDLIYAVSKGEEHISNLIEHTRIVGYNAFPILKRYIENDINGKEGWAATIALSGGNDVKIFEPEIALPIIEKALHSMYPGTRYYASLYLLKFPTNEAKRIALSVYENESDPDIKKNLKSV